MNKEEKMEKLEHMQVYFAKSFWVSFVLLLLSTVLCIVMHDFQVSMVKKYFEMDAADLNFILVLLLGFWKILIIQFTLIPALVIWGIRKCHCCKCK